MSIELIKDAQAYYDSTTDAADVEPAIMMAGFAMQYVEQIRIANAAEIERLKKALGICLD
jgi:hypothetical protein